MINFFVQKDYSKPILSMITLKSKENLFCIIKRNTKLLLMKIVKHLYRIMRIVVKFLTFSPLEEKKRKKFSVCLKGMNVSLDNFLFKVDIPNDWWDIDGTKTLLKICSNASFGEMFKKNREEIKYFFENTTTYWRKNFKSQKSYYIVLSYFLADSLVNDL